MHVATSSGSLSLSPASSAAMSAESRSARGAARRCAMSPRMYSVSPSRARPLRFATSESGPSMTLSSPRAISSDQPLKRSWSSTGTPSNSQMTLTGIGYANSSMRSIPPARSARSSRPSTISCTRGRSPSTTLGVNALLASPRRRV